MLPPLSSMSLTTTPLKVAFDYFSLETSHSSLHQLQLAGRFPEGPGVNTIARKKLSPYGEFANAISPQISQLTEHLGGRIPFVRNPLKATLPDKSGFTNSGSNVRGWTQESLIVGPQAKFLENRILFLEQIS